MDHPKDQSAPGNVGVDTGNAHVQKVVRQAHEHLRLLMRRRDEVVKRIGSVKRIIAGLANLFGDRVVSNELLELVGRKSDGRQVGFTKACRMILMDSACALTTRSKCEHMRQRMPLLLARHKDPMASVTTVLNRLVQHGEAQVVILESGHRAWQ